MTTIFPNTTLSMEVFHNTSRLNRTKADMVGPYVGVSIGCIFAGILIIISCILCVKALLHPSEDETPSRSSNRSNHIVQQQKRYRPPINPNPIEISARPQPPNPIEISARPQPPRPIIIPLRETQCIQPICLEFLQGLNLPKEYFEPNYDRCYCSSHYSVNKSKIFNIGGFLYTIPCECMRFGLRYIKPLNESEDIFQTWATSFYGTTTDQLENILRNRYVPFPGDRLLNDEIFSPNFFDLNHCYTSPSIYYTTGLKICKKYQLKSRSNEYYQVQVVLQCKQKPNTFEVTHGRSGLCNIISANQIKWKTSARSTIIPYGLLVHVVRQ